MKKQKVFDINGKERTFIFEGDGKVNFDGYYEDEMEGEFL